MSLFGSAVLVMAVMGAIFGIGLAYAGKKFFVDTDARVAEVRALLAGSNCGGCGYPGCDGLAAAIVEGKAPVNACKPAGAAAALDIARVMAVDAPDDQGRQVAQVMCRGGEGAAVQRSIYAGVPDCKAALLAGNGSKACVFGCLGFGTCVRACPYGALSMGADSIPVVDARKCTACGNCVAACPRKIIDLVTDSKAVYIRCRNHDRGARVTSVCKVGCIGCMLCVRACPIKAIQFSDNLARIDYSICDNCGICVGKCPTHAIEDIRAAQIANPDLQYERSTQVQP